MSPALSYFGVFVQMAQVVDNFGGDYDPNIRDDCKFATQVEGPSML
jgi:hypothetical protein